MADRNILDYKDLIVWQKSMDLVVQVYAITQKLPHTEQYALCDQMRRAVISIPSNIAEGQARNSNKEFVRFLSMAKGSKAELETQILLCKRLKFITDSESNKVIELLQEIGKMLNALQNSLTTNN